jgi:hypothetical protein
MSKTIDQRTRDMIAEMLQALYPDEVPWDGFVENIPHPLFDELAAMERVTKAAHAVIKARSDWVRHRTMSSQVTLEMALESMVTALDALNTSKGEVNDG